jgi:hypothetical protein
MPKWAMIQPASRRIAKPPNNKKAPVDPRLGRLEDLERAKGFEPSTPTLASWGLHW